MSATDKTPDAKKSRPGRPRSKPTTEFGRWFARSGLSPEDIRKVIDCGKSYVSDLIAGKKRPSLENAVKLIDFSKTTNHRILEPSDFLPDRE